MIHGFRIKNLRSVVDSGLIPIRKINILVGRNSSGKSTVLRFLPLLRQSVEQRTKGPILWYGRLVDFGSFTNAARDNDVSRGIQFEFELGLERKSLSRRASTLAGRTSDLFFGDRKEISVSVALRLGRSSKDVVGNIKHAILRFGEDIVELQLNADGNIDALNALGRQVSLSSGKAWWFEQGKILPAPMLIQSILIGDEESQDEYWEPATTPFDTEVLSALRRIAHGRTSDDRLISICNRLAYAPALEFFSQLKRLPGVSNDLRSRLDQLGKDSAEIRDLRRYVLLSKLTAITRQVDEELDTFARRIRYVEPLRATAQRYYRQQDLAVEEIDSRGENVAMFLGSLSEDDLLDLQGWMMSELGFQVSVQTGTGHVQIEISDNMHSPRNIADLGFGYSQVLPIALQLWRSSRIRSYSDRSPTLLAMEQPELHLHPDYQAKLADMVTSCVNARGGGNFRVFIETHSDHLINRLGALVCAKTIKKSDVQVLVVNEDGEGQSHVEIVEFDSDGLLGRNWPLGFFTPVEV